MILLIWYTDSTLNGNFYYYCGNKNQLLQFLEKNIGNQSIVLMARYILHIKYKLCFNLSYLSFIWAAAS